MANPAPTINQINAFNATQGTTIDFNIIGGTELVRSNRIYIYDLSDNSLICTHLYVSTESIHELPPNTDGSIVYESGKSSADFVNGAQYYAQIQTFTDIAGTEGGSGLSVAKMFWCLVDPTLTITTIPSTISTTSYNVSATYNANTSVVSNIIQQYQFSLYSATGSLLQSSGVVVGSGTQQGTSTAYDISYNFTGLSVGSSYYVTVEVTTTQGMSVTTQSNTFTVSIDTPTLGEATVVNNACDGYISVTSNLSSEYGGSGSGEIVSFETDSENVFTKLQVDLEPVQDLNGYDAPWVGGAGVNKAKLDQTKNTDHSAWTYSSDVDNSVVGTRTATGGMFLAAYTVTLTNGTKYYIGGTFTNITHFFIYSNRTWGTLEQTVQNNTSSFTYTGNTGTVVIGVYANTNLSASVNNFMITTSATSTYYPYENICPISGHDEVGVGVVGANQWDEEYQSGYYDTTTGEYVSVAPSSNWRCTKNAIKCLPNTTYYFREPTGYTGSFGALLFYDISGNLVGVQTSTVNLFNKTFTTPSNCYQMQMYANKGNFEGVTEPFSINYPSTDHDYHAYNGQTYTQEIEATYTPTVQENEPYQFKRTGDVGGDRESIELVGGSVAWNQLVPTLDTFNTEGGVTKTYSDGVATITSATARNGIYAPLNYQTGHKYIITCDIKTETAYDIVLGATSAAFLNITLTADNQWHTISGISNSPTSGNKNAYIYATTTYENLQVRNYNIIDLTQLFGSTIADYIYTLEQGQAGAGVAFFRKYFPKPYYPYDAGTIKSVEGVSAHKTVGFNQWDEEWEVGGYAGATGEEWSTTDRIRSKSTDYIKIVPSTTYYIKCSSAVTICYYDADKNFVSGGNENGNATFTTPNNAYYMRFATYSAYGTTYNNDICINLSWDGERNGEYEPYVEHSYPLDDSLTLRGIPKVANGKLYYDGDTYESDGTVTRKYGVVDLGSITPTKYDVAQGTLFRFPIGTTIKKLVDTATLPNIICAKYVTVTNASRTNKTISMANNTEAVDIIDNDYSSASAIQTAMNGVYLLYEKATPTSFTAQPFESIQKVTPNYGTEEFVTTSIVPVGNNTQYYTREVYGGYIDLVSGELVVTHEIRTYVGDSSEYWSKSSAYQGSFYINTDVAHIKNTANVWCSHAEYVTWLGDYSFGKYLLDNTNNTTLNVWIKESGTTVEQFKQYLADQNTAGTPLQFVLELATPQTYQLTPQQIQTLVGQNNVWSEQGDVELSYHIPITNLLVKRQDVADVSGNWLTLYSQPITQASDMDFTFIDFTNQYGKTYKYALVPLLTQTQSGVEVEVEGGYTVSDEVQSVFDGVFIADSTGSQKCKANVGYGNVDMNQTVGTITPIGAKYPVVITNSQNQYHNGSISGTIVPDDYYFNGNLSRVDMVNKRDELEQFLTNKRAKIIKDWNGKIWLVMIMDNVSCTFNNNYGMGIVNFSTNWIEVGDPTNQEDLQATGLINVGGV